jgi:hypothetical protein
MIKKILISIMVLSIMLVMVGTAAADPARIDIVPGDDSNPLIHPLDGSTVTYAVKMYEIIDSNTTTRFIQIDVDSGLTSARLYNPSVGVVDLTATSGTSASGTFVIPKGTTSMTFSLDITTSTPGEITIKSNWGTILNDPSVRPQDFGSASSSFIPEFPSVALPIATILGLMFIISTRKKKK